MTSFEIPGTAIDRDLRAGVVVQDMGLAGVGKLADNTPRLPARNPSRLAQTIVVRVATTSQAGDGRARSARYFSSPRSWLPYSPVRRGWLNKVRPAIAGRFLRALVHACKQPSSVFAVFFSPKALCFVFAHVGKLAKDKKHDVHGNTAFGARSYE